MSWTVTPHADGLEVTILPLVLVVHLLANRAVVDGHVRVLEGVDNMIYIIIVYFINYLSISIYEFIY